MMNPVHEKISYWSVSRIRHLLSRFESAAVSALQSRPENGTRASGNEESTIRERALAFSGQGGLDRIESLMDVEPNVQEHAAHVLERLTPFFDAGLLLRQTEAAPSWWLT